MSFKKYLFFFQAALVVVIKMDQDITRWMLLCQNESAKIIQLLLKATLLDDKSGKMNSICKNRATFIMDSIQ